VSQGSAATELRRGGRFKSDFVRHFFLDATLKEFLKLVYICQSYHKNKSGTFFYGSQCRNKRGPTTKIKPFHDIKKMFNVRQYGYN